MVTEGEKCFWSFETMIAPFLIKVFFWLGMIACIVLGILTIKGAHLLTVTEGNYTHYRPHWNYGQVALGLCWIMCGPVLVRFYCECAIVFFRIHETLKEINKKLGR
jgi:hypothetical protein